jgi:hypothetical protein
LNLRLRSKNIAAHELSALHAAIIDEVNRDGQRWISAATVSGESVIRTMVISYLTEERHVKDLQNALLSACRKQLPSAERGTGPLLESSLPATIQLAPATAGIPTA